MSAESKTRRTTGRWLVVGTALALGVAFLVAGLIRDDVGAGLIGLAVMIAYAVVLLLLRRRSESAALLGGAVTDERQEQILMRSSAITGQVLCVVLVVGMLVTAASGAASAGTWSALCAVGGASFILATVYCSRRG